MTQLPADAKKLPTLRIQSVLFRNAASDIRRSLEATARAVELARSSGAFGVVEIAFGDCSPTPTFTEDELRDLEAGVRPHGVERVDYAFFNANLGSAAGQNRLLERLASDYALILNPDTILAPNVLIELIKAFERDSVGLAEARQIPIEHPKSYDLVTGETSWATTACALIPRSVFQVVGGFDADSFFLYCDDVDLSWRIRLAGYKIIFRPTATIFHDKRLSDAGRWVVGAAEETYSAEGGLMMAQKYGPPGYADELERAILLHGSEPQKQVARRFAERRSRGELPKRVEHAERVAEFVGDNYTLHRW